MGTAKRERQKAGRQARLDAERTAEQRQRRGSFVRNLVIIAVLVIGVGLVVSVVSSKDNKTKSPAKKTTTTVPVGNPTTSLGGGTTGGSSTTGTTAGSTSTGGAATGTSSTGGTGGTSSTGGATTTPAGPAATVVNTSPNSAQAPAPNPAGNPNAGQ